MTRREGLKLSAITTAAAILAGCQKNTDPREKRRAHSTAMFLLVHQRSYLQQAYSSTPQNQLPGASLLRKVMPSVFESMRAYYKAQVLQIGEQVLVQKYNDIHTEMYNSTSSVPPTGTNGQPADQPPYSSPDECPCLIDNSCPPVEALLQF
jgi:hypothetical protein